VTELADAPPGVEPAEPAETVVRIRDAHVQFGGGSAPVRAVDGVDLRVSRGEVLALVGESGCGKTTLIRAIIGLEPLSSGEISVESIAVRQKARGLRTLRRRVQMIFQDPSGALNPRHTIYEAVAEGLRIHKVQGHEPTLVASALGRAGLRPAERYLGRYPHELSGGQRQRVLIAAAMALGPQLLLADEPVASLDASIRGEILALMRSFVDEHGVSIIAVTHDLGLAWNIADRVAVMYLGRIVEIGPAEAVLGDPQHPYTRALLSVVPEIERMEQQILTGETPDPSRIPPGCRFHPRCPVVASGEAARLGIEDRCRGVDVPLEPVTATPGHAAACHALTPTPTATPAPTRTPAPR
jgi:peptide/nickel transport system ATP-binding protein